ncbi:nodulation-signaling pathway 2 protein [Amborella trichopoda]|uniref:Uncharacterized protein n=1 Tax=Amborella trichopoda TaxID=13333 RepID=W1PD16_AMBTC|nr:nodulation-signaling pathway 2 protein [Amborella trichopoda]ERN05521.1 hypothetical protein AMTR_s00007p00262050 [Amborella trichopoda]|eukprot:XP_006843846.1 nodulation-signaling pathway 2 protein [Amborella trichopoda]
MEWFDMFHDVDLPQMQTTAFFSDQISVDSGAVAGIQDLDELFLDFPVSATPSESMDFMDMELDMLRSDEALNRIQECLSQSDSELPHQQQLFHDHDSLLDEVIESADLDRGHSETSQKLQEAAVMESSPVLCESSVLHENTESRSCEEEEKGMLMIHLLVAAAEAISNESHDLAEVLLQRLKKHVSRSGTTIARVAYYMYHGLQWLLSGHNALLDLKSNYRIREDNYLSAYRALIEIHPCSRLAHFTANQFILESVTSNCRNLHVIDFDIMDGLQWPPLMEALVSDARYSQLKSIKVTAIKWGETSATTARRLHAFARDLGLSFSLEEIELENLTTYQNSHEKESIDSDEEDGLEEEEEEEEEEGDVGEESVVIVNCMFRLLHMPERHSWQLSKLIEGSKELRPELLVLGHCSNNMHGQISEDFVSRFSWCLQGASAICDSLEWSLPTQKLGREMIERLFLGPRFCREVMFVDRAKCVARLPETFGYEEGTISERNIRQADEILRLHARDGHFYRQGAERPNELVLRWGSTGLLSVSSWHVP